MDNIKKNGKKYSVKKKWWQDKAVIISINKAELDRYILVAARSMNICMGYARGANDSLPPFPPIDNKL